MGHEVPPGTQASDGPGVNRVHDVRRVHDVYVAVDLGAGSGRVILGGLAPGEVLLHEVRRFHYPMERRDGHLRWPFAHILADIKTGLRGAAALARELGRPVRSVGVDTWGVDYGLLDGDERLIEDPICYRDERNPPAMDAVLKKLGRSDVFARTGVQFLVFNTLYQLWAHKQAGWPPKARHLLLMPDLINHALCGRAVIEYSNASTTQLLDPIHRTWQASLFADLDLPRECFPPVVPSGTDLGPLRPELAHELGLVGAHVVAPATHDTGSAVAGIPLQEGWAYISSGTWSLVGAERNTPLINADVARENFTNEGGACGTIRFLKNVMGLWLLESCRAEWKAAGLVVDHEALLTEAARIPAGGLIFPDDPRFLNPISMLEAVSDQLRESGQSVPTTPAGLTRVILDSLALRYASVLDALARLQGCAAAGVHVVGGGSQNGDLNQATADAAHRPVSAGPVEATAIGNLLVQAIAGGRFASLAEARAHVAANVSVQRFEPRGGAAIRSLQARYAELERRVSRAADAHGEPSDV